MKVIFSLLFCLSLLTSCLGQKDTLWQNSRAVAAAADQTPAARVPITAPSLSAERSAPQARQAGPTPTGVSRLEAGLPASAPTPDPSPSTTPTQAVLRPEDWKEWPVLPVVSPLMREVYQRGLDLGTNPRAFSILGDCQSQPEVFLGVYESEADYFQPLPQSLKDTVLQFTGSFNRYSPTVKDGTTEGALLWGEWNENQDKQCQPGETPIDCELRTHRPSIVFIHVGTHWEARNRRYLTILIDKILASGAVPVFVTKADNREHDERVNQTMADLAAEYGLPLWNFWASVQHLPENGMEPGSDMYLSPDGLEIHRQGGLQALDAVWKAVRQAALQEN